MEVQSHGGFKANDFSDARVARRAAAPARVDRLAFHNQCANLQASFQTNIYVVDIKLSNFIGYDR